MTDRELMQQALDALFNLRWAASERDKKNRIRQFDEFMDNSDETIEALRARLAQPECEWQGLTKGDADAAYKEMELNYNYVDFARAIEAKLKEKNT